MQRVECFLSQGQKIQNCIKHECVASLKFVVSKQIKFLKVNFTMFVLSLSNKVVGKMSIYKKGIRGTCKYIRETCSSVLLCQGNQVTIYNTIYGECLLQQSTTTPENAELSPLECPIMILNSLMGDSVSTNPVQVHTRGTEAYNPGNGGYMYIIF